MRAGPLSDIVGQAVKGFGHSADMPYLFLLVETDCVAGVRGLELRNASGAKSGRVGRLNFRGIGRKCAAETLRV